MPEALEVLRNIAPSLSISQVAGLVVGGLAARFIRRFWLAVSVLTAALLGTFLVANGSRLVALTWLLVPFTLILRPLFYLIIGWVVGGALVACMTPLLARR